MLKDIIIEKIKNIKTIQKTNRIFDDIRGDLDTYNYDNFNKLLYDIVNDFPTSSCKECGNETKYISFKRGYAIFCDAGCSNRYKAKDQTINEKISKSVSKFFESVDKEFFENRTETHRKTLLNQPEEYKFKKAIEKSEYMKIVHQNLDNHDKMELNNKISIAVKNSEKAKLQRIERSKLGAKALKEYKSKLTAEELKEFNKRYLKDDLDDGDKKQFKIYYKLVWYYTNKSKLFVENIEKRSVNFHLDHKYSIKQGFLDKICPSIIGHHINLEIIPSYINCSKGMKCSISKEDLLSSFEFLKIGDF